MFAVLFPLVMMGALAQASPAPASSDPPEIGRTRTSVCKRIVENTILTVQESLRNDNNIATEIALFRKTTPNDFSNKLYKANWEKQVTHYAVAMYGDQKAARTQLDELRDLAANSSDEAFKSEINAYVDALDQVQGDQAKIPRVILVGITIDNGRAELKSNSVAGVSYAVGNDPHDPGHAKMYATKYQAIADYFESSVAAIRAGENAAAAHAPKLLAACEKAADK